MQRKWDQAAPALSHLKLEPNLTYQILSIFVLYFDSSITSNESILVSQLISFKFILIHFHIAMQTKSLQYTSFDRTFFITKDLQTFKCP